MLIRAATTWLLAAVLGSFVAPARADEAPATGGEAAAPAAAAPAPDPTRGGWDAFLDPLRDFEDNQVTAGQKWIEDRTKVHVAAALLKAWMYDFNDPVDGTLIPLHSEEHHNSPSIDLGQIALSRPGEGWFIPGFGLKLDFGKVARDIKSDWNGNGAVKHGDTFETNDFEAEEAYLTWTVPDDSPALKGLSVKGGKFVTLLGAEVIEPWLNFNYSRSLLFSLAIPFTNTGVLVTYPITDKISVSAGPIVGWDRVNTSNRGWSGMGNVTWTVNDMVTLALNAIGGPEQVNRTGNKREVADLVATLKPTSALTLLLNYDYGREDGAEASTGNVALWQGLATTANYAFTDRASAAVRGEWFEDHGGSRTGVTQTLWEMTLTGKYLLTQHLYGQVEYRHDESADKHVFAANQGRLFLEGQDILGFDFAYVFN
jgi:hypothetical protein